METEYQKACAAELNARAELTSAAAKLVTRFAAFLDWAAPLARQLADKAIANALAKY